MYVVYVCPSQRSLCTSNSPPLTDLFSRGYSSGPHPSTHKYDNGLYITQILLVLASSRLPWRPFTIIGYSLGGAIAADFASYFPHLIKALFLIAPGGLIRKEHITFKSKVQYSGFGGLLPEKLVQWLISRRLYTGPETARSMEPETIISPPPSTAPSGNDKTPGDGNNEDEDPKGGLRSTAIYRSSAHTLLPSRPESTVSAIVDWQIVHHAGFVPAFISSIRYAPIHEQGGRWRKIGEYMRQPGAGFTQVHLILGEEDGIIVAGEVIEDARRYLGEENVKVKVFEGTGHEVAFERVVEIGEIVGEVLGV
jgi:pimeloyl-ACP methyl ester carboxylesterase